MAVGFGENDIIPASPPSEEARSYGGTPDRVVPSPQSAILGEDCPAEKQRLGFGGLGRREHHVFLVLLGATISVFLGSEMTPSCLRRHARVLPAYDCS
jgi:hypothetical protein